MRICLICVEIFAWGKYGGFGRSTRMIGRELTKQGHQVYAVVPRRSGQQLVEHLDGITVLGFSPYVPWSATTLFKQCDADVYHSCEPSFGTYLALKAMPDRKHMVTVRDPRNRHDWQMEWDLPSLNKPQVIGNYLYENNPFVRRSIRRMDAVYTTGKYLIPKVRSMYYLTRDPEFLPTPVAIPERVQKASTPTVCYVGRLDRRKQPTLFFDLAKRFPSVRFIAVGKSRDPAWDAYLRTSYANIPNLNMVGFIDQFSTDWHSRILERSWVMVNTATREALPNAFLEGAAHRCSILSGVDPGGFASQFGYHVEDGDFERGLAFLLEHGRCHERGERGYAHVKETFEMNRAMEQHVMAYEALLTKPCVQPRPACLG